MLSTPNATTSSSTPSKPVTDLYRPLAAQVKKPLAPFLPPPPNTPPSLAELFNLNPTTYQTRLEGKTAFLTPFDETLARKSALVGKKRNLGDVVARKNARRQAQEEEKMREENGLIGMRKRRKLGGEVLKKGMNIPYESLLPLHYLHTNYICQLLNLPIIPQPLPKTLPHLPPGTSPDGIHAKIVKADFTGIHLSILSARNPSLVGISGIVIEETASTFRLVPPDSRVRIIPKNGTQFSLSFPAYAPIPPKAMEEDDGEVPESPDWTRHLEVCPRIEMTLLGSAFGFRSGDRAGRKFRPAQGGGGGSGWGEGWVKGEWSDLLGSLDGDGVASGGASGTEKKKRKRGKSRRKDPPAGGSLQV